MERYIAVEGQAFRSQQDWINRATRELTAHPDYLDTQHPKKKGWQGHHFTALCFDQKNRRCRNGADFQRAEDDDAYPVWWIWPDQIAERLIKVPS